MKRWVCSSLVLSLAILGLLVPAAGAAERPKAAKLTIEGVKKGKVTVGDKERLRVFLGPFVEGEKVTIKLLNDGEVVEKVSKRLRRVKGRNAGRATYVTPKLVESGRYVVRARHKPTKKQRVAADTSPTLRVRFPDIDYGDTSDAVEIFNDLLADAGYRNTSGGDTYNDATARAVLAFRKVNGMERITEADAGIFKKLAAGKGGFDLAYPDAGKHVEVDLSEQTMVLARHGRPIYTYHVSTGTAATPTIKGHFNFYLKQPGTNSKGMIHSVYFIRGYATHGYASVPTYPASHGCVRNPPPDSLFIYNWIDLGDDIWVYD